MTDLGTNLGLTIGMHETNDSFPRFSLFVGPYSGASWSNARVFRHADHFGIQQSRTADRPLTIGHQVPVGRDAISNVGWVAKPEVFIRDSLGATYHVERKLLGLLHLRIPIDTFEPAQRY